MQNPLYSLEKKHIIIIAIIIISLISIVSIISVLYSNNSFEINDELMDIQTDNNTGAVILMFRSSQINVNKLGGYFGKTTLSMFASIVDDHVGLTILIRYHFDGDTCILDYYKKV
jgi:hypothetical protein